MTLGRRIMTVGAGTALAQVITAASTPILTRIFSPEAHAAWAIFLSLTLIFGGVATLRYELAVVLPPDGASAAALVLVGLASVLGISTLAAATVGLLGSRVLSLEMLAFLQDWVWLAPLSVLAVAGFQLGLAWCTREASFRVYAMAQFGLPTGILAAQVLFALAGYRNAHGLIGGTVCGQIAAFTILAIVVVRGNASVFRDAFARPGLLKAALTYCRYPLFMTPYTLVSLFRERLAYFLLARFGAPQSTGYYNLVARLVNMPNSLVVGAVRPVFFQHAVGSDLKALEEPVREVVRALGLCMLLCWGPCAIHATMLMELVFGPAWGPAAPYAIALSIPAIALGMGNWADRMLDVLGCQPLALKMELFFSVTAMGGLVFGFWWFGDLLSAVILQSALLTIYHLVWLLMLFRVAGYRVGRLATVLVELGLVAGASWGGAYLLQRVLNPWLACGVSFAIVVSMALVTGSRTWRRINDSLGEVAGRQVGMSA
ncbi:MAG: oligosaccharide flippase family protein [Opitutae bacterium]|nr:oligosaccharide flippase family protein [Opitutae bacterium]